MTKGYFFLKRDIGESWRVVSPSDSKKNRDVFWEFFLILIGMQQLKE